MMDCALCRELNTAELEQQLRAAGCCAVIRLAAGAGSLHQSSDLAPQQLALVPQAGAAV